MPKTEYLIYFTEAHLDIGIMPAHYVIATSRAERSLALKSGGEDVSDDENAWQIAEQQFEQDNEDYL